MGNTWPGGHRQRPGYDKDYGMKFNDLRYLSRLRQREWPGAGEADIPFRAIEVAGETGELMEAVKKYLRSDRGIGGSTATIQDIADELADCIIALDLLADDLEIDLSEAVAKKFNATSEKYDLSTRMEHAPPDQQRDEWATLDEYDFQLLEPDTGEWEPLRENLDGLLDLIVTLSSGLPLDAVRIRRRNGGGL